ncbi:uncharacterized protein LOC143081070 [Mytilus galloprovincialis]|uniref:uncharacterized protein LOC143081070 n=1 Tax=Mytilus galloprovincialis TaxID=29158 RepID=UPI003F7C3459
MKCVQPHSGNQRTERSGQTEEETIQEANHSDDSLPVTQDEDEHEEQPTEVEQLDEAEEIERIEPTVHREDGIETTVRREDRIEPTTRREENEPRKEKIKWPTNADKAAWKALDEDLENILEATLAGSVDRKITAMTSIIYSIGKDRFGVVPQGKQPTKQGHSNKRQKKIKELRGDLRRLKKRYKVANEKERLPLQQLRKETREKLKTLTRAETQRRDRKKKANERATFTANPFQYMKLLFGARGSGKLENSREEVEEHLSKTHSDERRGEDLEECEKLLTPEEPKEQFDESDLKFQEVQDVVRKARAGSAPGPNGISYRVYKNCPRLIRRLWKLLKVIWRRRKMTELWYKAEGCFIPKEENSWKVEQFRTISLLNIEGKIFLADLARRTTRYLLGNEYIDIAVQKGGMPEVSGCIEHTSVITQILREAKEKKSDLAVFWLDLANAYGSIPHKLVDLTLERYHVPPTIRTMLREYFDKIEMRFTAGDFTTAWQRLEVGILTGCTISVVLFAAAMNLIVKSVEKPSRGPLLSSGVRQPPVRAFMDDMTVTAKTVIEGRWTLEELERMIKWARMKFKPSKSRSLIVRKGKVQDDTFELAGEKIPTVGEKPVKCLGKKFDATLADMVNMDEVQVQLVEWLTKIDKSGLPGRYKAWIYQHGVLPRILWPLLVYEFPLSKVEALERKISACLRRWLGVPRSFSSIGLYSTGTKLQLPMKALTEEYKVTKTRQVMTLRDSKDAKVRGAKVKIRTGRKRKAEEAVKEAETRLKHSGIVGVTAVGRQGFGMTTKPRWDTANEKGRRELVQQQIRQMEEESRNVKAVGMKQQGSWLNWQGARSRALTWSEIWSMEGYRLSFLLRSVYDVLPSPSNLYTWGLIEDPTCTLCKDKPASLQHVLSACPVALKDERYTWRHDSVLKTIAAKLDTTRRKKRKMQKNITFVNFVRAGEKKDNQAEGLGILGTASDWQMTADIHQRMSFPAEIAATSLRQDIVIWSQGTRQVVLLELTVPWEDRIEEAYERKMAKYQQLIEDCKQRGWRTWCMAIEVGCRGFAGQSMWRALRTLGVVGAERMKLITEVCREAEVASQWIWRKRDEVWKSAK